MANPDLFGDPAEAELVNWGGAQDLQRRLDQPHLQRVISDRRGGIDSVNHVGDYTGIDTVNLGVDSHVRKQVHQNGSGPPQGHDRG
ncbi:hypothetical protein GCM10025782_29390 [Pedococcus ginsenosidimutans]|uniref:Uncharacterized protein n=1 Tax=Pedococcus ginsenosidimutans TaxID=490570 RepID=A0ABP8YHN6_9MICO